MLTADTDLTRNEYELFRKLVYEKSGINLGDQKMQLVRARLGKRLRQGEFSSFRAYYNHVVKDTTGEELCSLIDAISTNTTHLFREKQHFEFLEATLKQWVADRRWRAGPPGPCIWSAACSSGEEPHTLAMVVADTLKGHHDVDPKILATDISSQMLRRAKLGLYELDRVDTVPSALAKRYLAEVMAAGQPHLQLVPELQRLITYARLNLMSSTFPFRHGFDVIFCRNVMIYFDKPTQQRLVQKLAHHLRGGGYLIIGHSESLNGIEHGLTYVEPTIYSKQ